MGEAKRRVLPDIGDAQPEFAAIAHGRPDRRSGISHHDPDVSDAGVPDGLNPVEQNGLIGSRQQLLRGRVRNGP